MASTLADFFSTEQFMPHGHCFLWQPSILWLNVISDAGITIAYYSIPFALIYFIRQRQDVPFKTIFWLFGAFILLCGTTHLISIWVVWNPDYAIEGLVKALTAITSLGTFYALVTLMPHALTLPSPKQLETLNEELQNAYHNMEIQVQQRTAELTASNKSLQNEIHQREKSQQQLNKALEKLTRSNNELQRFAYICSHDLQEPARMVGSYAKLLSQRMPADTEDNIKKYLHFLTDGAERMQAMIKSILSYSRLENEEQPMTQVDCHQIVKNVLGDLQPAIAECAAKIICDDLPTVNGNPTQIAQLFQNLLTNAMKFHKPEQPPEIHIGAKRTDDGWQFFVRDNGIGIDPGYQEKIFVIFQRLNRKEEYPGTGIGLATCKKIVERMGGKIFVESAQGQGATFYFIIPDLKEETHGNP
jgi:signal transduction histidine kinase